MFTPILDRVLVRRVEEKSDSVIEIPAQYRQDSQLGEVVAIGQFVVVGGDRMPLSVFVNPGDLVRFSEYGVEKFSVDGEELILLRVQDIRGRETRKASAAGN